MKRLLLIIGLCVVGPGCSVVASGVRTMVIEPFHFSDNLDRIRSHHQHKRMANQAWRGIESSNPCVFSNHYEIGFKDGFTDFLDAGGTGSPPALPPRKYWGHRYQNPQGHQEIEDWFAGFRHGSAEAQQSGYRTYATVPTSIQRPQVAVPDPLLPAKPPHLEQLPPGSPKPAPPQNPAPDELEVGRHQIFGAWEPAGQRQTSDQLSQDRRIPSETSNLGGTVSPSSFNAPPSRSAPAYEYQEHNSDGEGGGDWESPNNGWK